MTDKKLIDKIAVVTGGARGIGGEIAVAFAQAGADVVVADLLEESAAAPVLLAIKQAGRRSLFARTDVSDAKQVRTWSPQRTRTSAGSTSWSTTPARSAR
jgi:NAD(P)-dependent dehydrogenase (short-subunit alcohol dehydrogenase family)